MAMQSWLILFCICLSSLFAEQIRDFSLVATSRFKDPQHLIGKRFALLENPTTLNQFIILNLHRPVKIAAAQCTITAHPDISVNTLRVYGGQDLTALAPIAVTVSRVNETYTMEGPFPALTYVKIVFGNKPSSLELAVGDVQVFAVTPDVVTKPVVTEVQVALLDLTSVVLTYHTIDEGQTQVVYGNNFDFIYEGYLAQVYQNQVPTNNHRVVITGLLPQTTYAYFIKSIMASGDEYQTPMFYFSTKRKSAGEKK